jgi:integrase
VKRKPTGLKYRNLHARSDSIYYERIYQKKRICLSTKTDDWAEAAAFRDLAEARMGIGRFGVALRVEAPRFAEFAKRYLEEDTSHLAPTTRGERDRMLAEDGPLLPTLGALRLDEITAGRLREWWHAEVTTKVRPSKTGQPAKIGRSTKTGRTYLDALAGVLAYAVELELIEENAVDAFRTVLRRKTRTQRGRAESDLERTIAPIEDADELARLVESAAVEGTTAHLLVLLLLDAGLRLGEALGLRWKNVVWAENESDPRRALVIAESRPRGGAPGPTKSGRTRRVALSKRLHRKLLAEYRARFAPDGEALVLPNLDPANFRGREWRRLVKRARIGHRALKDLRDTYASQLLTAGVQLGYVSQQLGHADVAVTARHYARWAGGDDYRAPVRLGPGELPADVLAKLAESHQSPKSWVSDAVESLAAASSSSAAGDSNSPASAEAYAKLRQGAELEHETGLEPATSTLATWCSTN